MAQSYTFVLCVRLLVPRYDVATILRQVEQLSKWSPRQLAAIPTLGPQIFNSIVAKDVARAGSTEAPETGPVVFRAGESVFRTPVAPLPIDLLVAWCLQYESCRRVGPGPQQGYHYAAHSTATPPEYCNQGPPTGCPPNWSPRTEHIGYQYGPFQQSHHGPQHTPTPRSIPDCQPAYDLTNTEDLEPLALSEVSPEESGPNLGSITFRIRGGGDSLHFGGSTPPGPPIVDIPFAKREGSIVLAFVSTSEEEGISYLVGVVADKKYSESGDSSVVNIDASYLSTHGYIAKQKFSVSIDDVYAIAETSEPELSLIHI